MAVPRALTPLTSAATLRCGVYLVIGGLVAAAYGLLAAGFVQMFRDPTLGRPVIVTLAAVTAVIVLVPPFLHPVRVLQVNAARTLLDTDIADTPGRGRGAVARGFVWFLLHLATGALAALSLLTAIPFAVSLIAWHLGSSALQGALGPLADLPALLAVVLAVVFLLVPPYLIWTLRALLRTSAPVLLGPSAQDRIARLEADKRELAARNALARDLHDSVGHALTVTTLQAAAAERALGRDPEFVRSALGAIGATGREAVAELDRVLGVLRTGAPPPADEAAAHDRGLSQVPALAEEARATGARVALVLPPDADGAVSRTVSREAYAIVREALTNALRHGDGTIEVHVELAERHLILTIRNGLRDLTRGSGRGLMGMQERAEALGGVLTSGRRDREWHVDAALPREVP
ncbi:sensor histidine kinase [Pseudactinotalea sp. Z1732]|uniref:sensor histidine kinase n=1 Tax=Micrococcales TaxID=85006 RepID=UPI003C7BD307